MAPGRGARLGHRFVSGRRQLVARPGRRAFDDDYGAAIPWGQTVVWGNTVVWATRSTTTSMRGRRRSYGEIRLSGEIRSCGEPEDLVLGKHGGLGNTVVWGNALVGTTDGATVVWGNGALATGQTVVWGNLVPQ